MKHFICTGGCGGESAAAGVCQAEGCKKEGEPLLSCECTDSIHDPAHSPATPKQDEES
jgi:hypothetical protein